MLSAVILQRFITAGDDWRMFSYDGSEFVKMEKLTILFDTLRGSKERWVIESSVMVDCMVVALTNGGIVWKSVLV